MTALLSTKHSSTAEKVWSFCYSMSLIEPSGSSSHGILMETDSFRIAKALELAPKKPASMLTIDELTVMWWIIKIEAAGRNKKDRIKKREMM